jgi:hypothetical protein
MIITAPNPKEGATARLEVTRVLRGDPALLCPVLVDPSWLGQLIDGPTDRPDLKRVQTDLALAMTDDPRTLTFRKAALVDLGTTRDAAGRCRGEVAWRASTLAPLFPVFAGSVTIRDDTLHLRGVYAPPGGDVGLLVDRTFLHYFARRTGAWFLDRLNAEIAAASARPRESAPDPGP